ncbi:MAG: PIN domain nuclease [Sporichthyaceae bacterium]
MGVTGWMLDKSAFTRLGDCASPELWIERISRGLVRITTVTRLEIGFSARSGAELRSEAGRPPLSLLTIEHLTPAMEARAVAVQTMLADRGQHRAPSIPDLLVAAAAEIAGLTVLHNDKDFDLISDLTGQPVERLDRAA